MSNTKNSNTCMAIGLVIAAIAVGVISYYIGTVQPLWVAVVAFFILLALGLWLVQKICGGSEEQVYERELETFREEAAAPAEAAPAAVAEPDPAPAPEPAAEEPAPAAEPEVVVTEAVVEKIIEDPEQEITEAVEQVEEVVIDSARPAALDAPRDGKGDDLKKIKGVGPKLEKLLNSMGFYHFDQIAAWSDKEIAWVDENLQGFKGRVTRDNWVEQAKTLAAGGATEFSKKVDKGGVY